MKELLIILFSLLSIVKNQSDDSNENCPDKEDWVRKDGCYYYCLSSDGTPIQYKSQEECEKTCEWINGRCKKNDTENIHTFLPKYKDKSTCEEEKADWVMTYCAFHSFSSGKIYEKLKNNKEIEEEDDYFNEEICVQILKGTYLPLDGQDSCFFNYGQKISDYLCDSDIIQDEECPQTMDSELCKDLNGIEYGTCSFNEIYGFGQKEYCKSLNKNYWKTGENESFCYEYPYLNLTKDSCLEKVRGKWKEVPQQCIGADTQFHSFHSVKIIFIILLFIFIV